MSALGRIYWLVSLFFGLIATVCMLVLLRQASHDVGRELSAAQAMVTYLSEVAERDSAALQGELTDNLRHVRVRWLQPGQVPEPLNRGSWLDRQIYPSELAEPVTLPLADGRRLQLSVDPADEIDEVWDSLLRLLTLFCIALLLSLLAIRWALRPALAVLDELLAALERVSQGRLDTRLGSHTLAEARQLAGHFNRMVTSLQSARRENDELTHALLALQERERTQLAQALHDDLGQYLAGIRAQACLLQAVKDQPTLVAATAVRLDDNCEQLQNGFRRLTRELYPVMLEHLELPEAIRLLAEQWQEAHGIELRLHVDKRLPVLPLVVKEHLYRLLQEALTNVARHAHASRVHIRLRLRGERLRLLVRDNGCGAGESRPLGIGLRSMRERAHCLGGHLILASRSGGGWAVLLDFPLMEAMAHENIAG
ncbi:HAMP domain-containing sensor histidine kinase [Pseudomonas saudiphocaensis]|uniref:HAMP domain-containing sensor histidine kinase n=1 Tax=Pseudomonas saudiphocaensis TaxID=1499686 RepID=UPI00187D30E6|nr:histidine kinase [Pseudomonas saudiphocaensis]MBE7927757.1 HAMP domain-containing protein [Pseudomonas saudiphocaensis]